MPLPNSDILAKEVIMSLPVKVHLAGFTSDTVTLAQHGWDLSVSQELDFRSPMPRIILALRHSGLNQYALCEGLNVRHEYIWDARKGSIEKWFDIFKVMEFRIHWMAPEIKVCRLADPRMVPFDSFRPMDATPTTQMIQENVSDIPFFKTINPNLEDIVVQPEHVDELLKMVMKAQEPMIKQIAAKERSRKNFQSYQARAEMTNVKPAHEVRAQIITLAG